MTITTGRYITFKSIYLEDTSQHFLCDFFRSASGDRYTVQVELAGQWTIDIVLEHTKGYWRSPHIGDCIPQALLGAVLQEVKLAAGSMDVL